jgi:hypothetical protein
MGGSGRNCGWDMGVGAGDETITGEGMNYQNTFGSLEIVCFGGWQTSICAGG